MTSRRKRIPPRMERATTWPAWTSAACRRISSGLFMKLERLPWWCWSTAGHCPFAGRPNTSRRSWRHGGPASGADQAVADVLFGDYNPSGRLAITIPRHVGQLPAYYNYKPFKAYWIQELRRGYVDMPATPLYPFGFGLSYTIFEYSNLRIDPPQIHAAGSARVSRPRNYTYTNRSPRRRPRSNNCKALSESPSIPTRPRPRHSR